MPAIFFRAPDMQDRTFVALGCPKNLPMRILCVGYAQLNPGFFAPSNALGTAPFLPSYDIT